MATNNVGTLRRRSLAALLLGMLLALSRAAGAAADERAIPINGEATLRFATVEEGAAVFARRDAFLNSLSRFDLQARLHTDRAVSVEQIIDFYQGEVVAWQPEQKERLLKIIVAARERMSRWHLPLPPEILLIQTTGREEGHAAYTRGAAIVLPTEKLALTFDKLLRLFIHEIFHVLSRYDAKVRAELYRVIGFEVCNEIALPPNLRDRKITNPDAPRIDCRITLDHQGRQAAFAPVLLASRDYDAQQGGTIFDYLTFRLIEIELVCGVWRPVLRNGQATFLDPREMAPFYDRIGRNTKYIIHPDEILADNFILLAMGDLNLATPRIVEEMGRILSRDAAKR